MRTPSAVAQQQEIERLASEHAKPATASLLSALRGLRDGFTLADIEREIERDGAVRVAIEKKLRVKGDDFKLAIDATLDGAVVAGRRAAVGDAPARIAREAARAAARPRAAARGAKWAAKRSAALVADVSGSVRLAIRAVVSDGVKRGVHPSKLAREVREVIGLDPRRAMAVQNFRAAQAKDGVAEATIERRAEAYASRLLTQRAEMIATSETFSALNQGRADLWSELVSDGVVTATEVTRTWVSSRDDLVDEICNALDGETVQVDEEFPGGAEPGEVHPGCFPGDALVSAGGVLAATRRWYEGDLVILRTRSGERLTATPNHPVLTDRGWVPARVAHEVGHVLRLRGGRELLAATVAGAEHDHDVPTRIEEIANALRMQRGMRVSEVPVSAPDFHGDGRGSEVAVVWSDRELRRRLDPMLAKEFGKEAFPRRHPAGDSTPFGHATRFVEWALAAADGFVRGLNLSPSLAFAHAGPFQALGVRLPAWFDAALSQARFDCGARNAEPLGDRVDRFAGSIERDDLFGVEVQSARAAAFAPRDAELQQSMVDRDRRDTEFDRDPLHRFAGVVERDEVLSVDVHSFAGHVFNLQTREGWYAAGSSRIVTHNCRCTTTYAIA